MKLKARDLKNLAIDRSLQSPALVGTPPETPRNLSATARNLGLLIQWSYTEGADGYNIVINSTQDFSQPDVQVRVDGETSREYFYTLGNVTATRYIAIQSYKGTRLSALSSSVTASTTAATSASTGPADTDFTNVETIIASVTLTTTGNTIFVIGKCILRQNGAEKNVNIVLKEDGVGIDSVQSWARNSTGPGNTAIVQNFSTPSATSHTYIMTAQNVTDAATCTAGSIRLLAAEIPLLVSAGAQPPAPSISPKTQTPQTILTGSQRRGGFGWT